MIGAGFASGKEIYTFFYKYGIYGLIGMILSIILVGYIIYKIFKIIKKYNINNYKELLSVILNSKKTKYINFENILNFIINIFLLTTFFIMCAGFSAYFNQEFGINQIYPSIIIAISSYVILNKNIKGIEILNFILMPIVIIILIILGTKSINTNIQIISYNNSSWIIKSILYASYNTITLASVLIPMKKHIKQKGDNIKIVVISSILIIALGIIIFLLLLNINADVSKIELPAVYACRKIWKNLPIFIWNYNIRSNSDNSYIISIWLFKQCIRKSKAVYNIKQINMLYIHICFNAWIFKLGK